MSSDRVRRAKSRMVHDFTTPREPEPLREDRESPPSDARARAVGNAVFLDHVGHSGDIASWGMPSGESAEFVAGQINRLLNGLRHSLAESGRIAGEFAHGMQERLRAKDIELHKLTVRAELAEEDNKSLRNEIASVLQMLDELAEQWGDEGNFRRGRDRLRNLVEPHHSTEPRT